MTWRQEAGFLLGSSCYGNTPPPSIWGGDNWVISYEGYNFTICTAGSWGLEDHNGVSINIRLVKYGVFPFFCLFKYQKHYSLVIEKMSFLFFSFRNIFFSNAENFNIASFFLNLRKTIIIPFVLNKNLAATVKASSKLQILLLVLWLFYNFLLTPLKCDTSQQWEVLKLLALKYTIQNPSFMSFR